MVQRKLIGGNAWIITLEGGPMKVKCEQVVGTVLACKEEFSDSQLRRMKAAIDRETLHRSKLIKSQTKVT